MSACVSMRIADLTELAVCMTHNCLSWSDYTILYEHVFFLWVKKMVQNESEPNIYKQTITNEHESLAFYF